MKHRMKNQLLNFNGLYGDHARAILPDFVHCESIETRSHKHDWKIRPHIHTSLFQVFCVESGIGTLLVEQRKIAFIGPCLLVIPENTLHGFEFEASVGRDEGRGRLGAGDFKRWVECLEKIIISGIHSIPLPIQKRWCRGFDRQREALVVHPTSDWLD